MYLQFLGDIAAVGDDRISGDAQMVGYLLVGHSLHQRHDDITLALAQRVVLTLVFHHAGNAVELHALLLSSIFEMADDRNEDVVLHIAVEMEPLLIIIYIVERGHEFVVVG